MKMMSGGCHLGYVAYFALSVCGTVTVVSATVCKPHTCGVDRAMYIQSRKTCITQVFPHEPKEFIEDRCGGDNPFECSKRHNRYYNVTGVQRRLRLDMDHKLPSGRVTHVTFSTSHDSHKAFSGSLVVVQMVRPQTSPPSVRVLAVAAFSCPSDTPTWVDQCVQLKKVVRINADVGDYYLGFFSTDDDESQRAYNWYYLKKSAKVGMYVTDPLLKVLNVDDVLSVYPATLVATWPSSRVLLYLNAKMETASCRCNANRMCSPGGRCLPYQDHCDCAPGYRVQDKVCKVCPKNFYGPRCELWCDCVNSKYCDNNGTCVCNEGYAGVRCHIDSYLCEECENNKPYDTCYEDADGEASCGCPLGFRITSSLCQACRPGEWGANCAMKCSCAEMYSINNICDPLRGYCQCKPGWSGPQCNKDINECNRTDSPCGILERCFNTRGSYRCDCLKNFVRVEGGKCEEFGLEVITDPIIPFLDRATPIYIVLSAPKSYSSSIKFEIVVDDITCEVTLWNGKPGPDGYVWDKRPFSWAGPLMKINWPSTVFRLFYFFSHRMSRIRVTSKTSEIPPWDQEIRADPSNNSQAWEQCVSRMNLNGASSSAKDLNGFRVSRDADLRVVIDVKIPPCSSGSRVTNGQWSLYPYTLPKVGICPDQSTLEPVRLKGRMTDVQLIIPARHLPAGIIKVCNNVTIIESKLGTRRILKCGYVEIQPVNKIIFILKPVTQYPINVLLDTSIVFDVRETYSLEGNEADEPLPGKFSYDWQCNEDNKGALGRTCGNRFPILRDQTGRIRFNISEPTFAVTKLYRVTVTAKKAAMTTTDSRSFYVTSPSFLPLSVRCVYNCLGTANVNDYVKLNGAVPDDLRDAYDMRGEWLVTTTGKSWSGQNLSVISSGTSSTLFLDIIPDVFTAGGTVTFTFKEKYNVTGIQTYVVTFGGAPAGGSCIIQPLSGSSLVTKFSLHCHGWTDPEGPLEYKLFVKPINKPGKGPLLASNFEPVIKELVFPAGEVNSDESLSYKCLARVEITNRKFHSTIVEKIITVYPLAQSGGTSRDLPKTFAEKLLSPEELGNWELKNTYAVSLAEYINEDASQKADKTSEERRAKMREQVLEYFTNTVTEGYTSVMQASPALVSATSEKDAINDNTEEKIRNILTVITKKLSDSNKFLNDSDGLNLDNLDDLARQQLIVIDRLARKSALKRLKESQENINKVEQLNSFFDSVGLAMLAKTSREETSSALTVNTSAMGVTWVAPGYLGDIKTKAQLEKSKVEVVVNTTGLPSPLQDTDLQLQLGATTSNYYNLGNGSDNITLPVVLASMWNKVPKRRVNLTELPQPIYIFIKANHSEKEKSRWEIKTFSLEDSKKEIVVKAFRDRSTIVNITFTPSNVTVSVQVILQRNNISSTTVFNESVFPRPESKREVLKHVVQEPSSLLLPSQDDVNENERILVSHISSSQPKLALVMHVLTAEVSCKTWDNNASAWKNYGCKVATVSTFDEVVCECTHLSIFTATFYVTPNLLTTDDLLLFGQFFHNPVMVTVVVLLWIIYLMGLYWAYHADWLDREQRGIGVLEDNSKEDEYLYLVCTVTGWGRNTGTTANVYIYLSGTAAKTRVHRLADEERDTFFSGAENWFLISSPHDLGDLNSVVIWHDNSGPSPDWYLNEVFVREVDGDQAWHCLYNDWLSVHRGLLCVEVPATSPKEMAKHRFYHFVINTSQSLRTEHLWLSFVTKPNYSTFMRMQRLTCALCILLSMMMASLMFHGLPTDDPRDQVSAGPITFNIKDIVIGLQTSLIVFPINLLLVELFCWPRAPRPTYDTPSSSSDGSSSSTSGDSSSSTSGNSSSSSSNDSSTSSTSESTKNTNKNKNTNESPVHDENEGKKLRKSVLTRPGNRRANPQARGHESKGDEVSQSRSTHIVDMDDGYQKAGDMSDIDRKGVYYDPQCSRRKSQQRSGRPDQGQDNIGNKDYLEEHLKISESQRTYHDATLWCTDKGQGRPEHHEQQLSSDGADGIKGPRGFATQRHIRFSEGEGCRGGSEQTGEHQHGDHTGVRKEVLGKGVYVDDGCHGDECDRMSTKTARSRQLEMEYCRKAAQLRAEQEVNINRNATRSSEPSTQVTSTDGQDSEELKTWNSTVTTKDVKISLSDSSDSSDSSSSDTDEEESSRFILPWWWLYVMWVISIITAVTLSLVIVLYGLKMGYQKSVDWIISFFTAWINDTFLMQPLQIIGFSLMAVVLLRRTVDIRDYSAEYHTNKYQLLTQVYKLQELDRQKGVLREEWRHIEYHYPITTSEVKDIQARIKRDARARIVFRETLMYVVYVVIVAVVLLGHLNLWEIYHTNTGVRRRLSDPPWSKDELALSKVGNRNDIWNYLDTTFLRSMQSREENPDVNSESYRLCLARLRQIRQQVQPDYCQPGATYGQYLRKHPPCLENFSPGIAETRDFAQSWKPVGKSTNNQASQNNGSTPPQDAWRYQSEDTLGKNRISGIFGTYPGGGYVFDLPHVVETARDNISELRAAGWLDSASRAVIVTCTLYQANNDLATEITLLWELSPVGRVWSRLELHTTRMHYYYNLRTRVVAGCEVMLLLLTLMYIYFETKMLNQVGWRKYLSRAWSWLEILVVTLIFLRLSLHVQRLDRLNIFRMNVKAGRNSKHLSFAHIRAMEETLESVQAILLSLVILKVFKVLRFSKRFRLHLETFAIARTNVVGGSMLAAILLLAFASFSYPVFGSILAGYKTFNDTLLQLFTFWLGQSDFDGMLEANRSLGPLFFFLFVCLFSILAVFFFVSITLEAYEVARVSVVLNIQDDYLLEYLKRSFLLLIGIVPPERAVRRRRRPYFPG